MRLGNTVLLLAVLLALGAYVYWVELPEEARQEEEKRLLTFEEDAVTKVTLTYPERTIVLEKDTGGDWQVVEPLAVDADDAAVENMLKALTRAEVTRTLEDVADRLESYGLAPAEASVALELGDDATVPVLKVGATTSVGFSTYVQRGDDPNVYLTGAAINSGMKKELSELRDKTVLEFEDEEVRKIMLAHGAETIVLERQGDGEDWRIIAPVEHRADAAQIRTLLASARGLRINDFVSDEPEPDLATWALDAPRFTLTVWVGDDRAQKSVLFGRPHEDETKKVVYAKRGEHPAVYTLPDYSLKNVEKDLATLRDKSVLTYDPDAAATIEVVRKDGLGFTLAKEGDAWTVTDPGEGEERMPTINRLVDDIAGFEGSEIVAEGAIDFTLYGLDDPDVTVVVRDAGDAVLGSFVAVRGPADDAEASSYVAPADGSIVYSIRPFSYDRVAKKLSDLRDPPKPESDADAEAGADAGALGDDLAVEDLGADG